MISQDKMDLIERYLSFEMSEDERSSFESRLDLDQELSAEFERRETAHQALDFLIAENLRSELKVLEQEDTKIVSLASRSRRNLSFAIAASVLVLIGAFFMFLPSKSSSPLQLAMANYESPDFAFRGGVISAASDLATGQQALENNNYENAINSLAKIADDSEYGIQASYYLGHAYFLSQQYAAADERFAIAAQGEDLRYTEDAQWYGLLSCLAQGLQCIDQLEAILQSTNHSYQEQAQAIQQKIDK